MNVPKFFVEMVCLFCFLGQASANIDSREHFCGRKLTKTLSELCSIYNGPGFGQNRFRRHIVQECCRAQCTRRYLVKFYCSEAHSHITKLLETTSDNTPIETTTTNKPPKSVQTSNVPQVVMTEESDLIVGNPFLQNDERIGLTSTFQHYSLSNQPSNRNIQSKSMNKRRVKKTKLKRRPHLRRFVPPPNIGRIENSQKPFYVWHFSKTSW